MSMYEDNAFRELLDWQREMTKKPGFTDNVSKGMQKKMNSLIPEKAHEIITDTIKNMVKAVLFGSEYTSGAPIRFEPLVIRENLVKEKINFYKKAAAVSGAGTGAGGFLLGLADFPILISLKMKLLFDVASIYGFDVRNYKERLYILYVFQLAFSSQERRNGVFNLLSDWDNYSKGLPVSEDNFDWRTFQQEYRDYIDLAKLFQLVPGIGAAVGAYANYKLMDKLGETAINAYRMRVFKFEQK
jgi:hypothetical protein